MLAPDLASCRAHLYQGELAPQSALPREYVAPNMPGNFESHIPDNLHVLVYPQARNHS